MKGLLFVDFKIYKVYFIVLDINSVCSIRHDFYDECRDSAEGGRFCHPKNRQNDSLNR